MEYLLAAGAEVNGRTLVDRTDLWELVPRSELSPALWLESERMGFGLASLSEADLAKAVGIVLMEHKERVESVVDGAVAEIIHSHFFPADHPYGKDENVIGLKDISLAEVRAFHRRHYAPGNALLVLCGDFEVARTKELIRSHFESVPAGAPAPLLEVRYFRPPARLIVIEARAARTQVVIEWSTPALYAPGDAELDAVAALLRSRFASLEGRGLIQGGQARQNSMQLGSVFGISASIPEGVQPQVAAEAIMRSVNELAHQQIDRPTLEATFESQARGWLLQYDALLDRARLMGVAELYAGTPNALALNVQRFLSISPQSLARVVQAYLPPERAFTAIIKHDPQAPREGRLVSAQ
jgi:predicted Zn-dependent peptidase